jgi:hypothetical protein
MRGRTFFNQAKFRRLFIASAALMSSVGLVGAADASDAKFKVIDNDTERGIAAQIWKDDGKSKVLLADIDGTGEKFVAVDCTQNQGVRYYAKPVSGAYQDQVGPRACDPVVVLFRVSKKGIITRLRTKAATLTDRDVAGVAAQGWNEIYARTSDDSARIKALELAGIALDVDQPTVSDPAQKSVVASPELIQKVKQFQLQNNLVGDGILGSRTLAVLAGGTVNRNYFTAN